MTVEAEKIAEAVVEALETKGKVAREKFEKERLAVIKPDYASNWKVSQLETRVERLEMAMVFTFIFAFSAFMGLARIRSTK